MLWAGTKNNSGLESPIDTDEMGKQVGGENLVWTGTAEGGVGTQYNCDGWTSSLPIPDADVGRVGDYGNSGWTRIDFFKEPNFLFWCSNSYRLYCVQISD